MKRPNRQSEIIVTSAVLEMADVGVQKAPEEGLPESRCMDQRPHCWGRRKIFMFWGRSSRS